MSDESENVNISKLRELAVRGKDYREEFEVEYYGESATFELRPLVDIEFLPIAAFLEDKLGLDAEEAQEMVEEERDPDDGSINPSNFDAEFVEIMQKAAIQGMTSGPDASDEECDEVRAEVESLQGGKSLEIAETVLDISSDAESAKSFRRDGGGE
jgi:hypothetical protein